ncbi:unnamed protein product [Rotaria sp. Silwood1]|nr:unnamed protein product [Rotaria sp. Silwood1]
MNEVTPSDETLKQGGNQSWLLILIVADRHKIIDCLFVYDNECNSTLFKTTSMDVSPAKSLLDPPVTNTFPFNTDDSWRYRALFILPAVAQVPVDGL